MRRDIDCVPTNVGTATRDAGYVDNNSRNCWEYLNAYIMKLAFGYYDVYNIEIIYENLLVVHNRTKYTDSGTLPHVVRISCLLYLLKLLVVRLQFLYKHLLGR